MNWLHKTLFALSVLSLLLMLSIWAITAVDEGFGRKWGTIAGPTGLHRFAIYFNRQHMTLELLRDEPTICADLGRLDSITLKRDYESWRRLAERVHAQVDGWRGSFLNVYLMNVVRPDNCVRYRKASVPMWMVVVLAALYPAASLLVGRPIQRRRRRRMGLCIECGYDFRGSTKRCPECGDTLMSGGPVDGRQSRVSPETENGTPPTTPPGRPST